ncbi:MAG: hypothetical protein Q9Q40_11275 [Acidobacteriota bacterium]|nr:hypothetical protein [Acidobacteriota bacterium]MDQ7086961.1 hypothetical protein [Acidobacteriota bacterium]
MPYCPQCQGEFRDGFTHCGQCQVELVHDRLPADPFADPRAMAEMLRGRDLVPAFSGSPAGIGELRDALARRQIPSVAASPGECGASCRPELLLLLEARDVERAEAFFHQEHRPTLAAEFVQVIAPGAEEETAAAADGPCPACGAAARLDADGCCGACGLFLGG